MTPVGPTPPDEVPDLTAEEFRHLLAKEVGSLRADVRPIYERYAVPPVRMVRTWEFDARMVSAPIWLIARDGSTVIGYDEVEEHFGIGTVRTAELIDGGVVEEWGTFGERLRWTLLRFPDPAAHMS